MLHRIISFIFRRRHYWRQASFSEVAELYVSRLMTVFAINIVSLFMAIYLFKLGYSVGFIAVFYGCMYLLKVPLMMLFARYIAYFGPKHGVLLANVIRIPSLVAMLMVPDYGFVALVIFGLFQSASAGIYGISYGVDFSKVRHVTHTGKELGVMSQIEQTAKVMAPIIGGVIATFYSPGVAVGLASILFVLAAAPLFRTIEPVAVRSKVAYAGFPWRLTWRSFVTAYGVGHDFVVSGIAWTLFIAVTVLASIGGGIYASIGALASIGAFVSMLGAWFFGKVVDRRQGDALFTAGIISNTFIHLFRPFAVSPASVLAVSMTNETATSAYVLPWTRATFELADISGHRIAYFTLLGMAENLGAALGCFALAAIVWLFGLQPGLQIFFVLGAAIELTMLAARRHTR